MKKQVIITGIIMSLFIICFNGCVEQDADIALTIAELAERENKPGDIVEFKGSIIDVHEMNLSYGQYYILAPNKYIKFRFGVKVAESIPEFCTSRRLSFARHFREQPLSAIASPE